MCLNSCKISTCTASGLHSELIPKIVVYPSEISPRPERPCYFYRDWHTVERSFRPLVVDYAIIKTCLKLSWRIERKSDDRHAIFTPSGKKIGAILVADESVKGIKEFWAVYFATSDLEKTLETIEKAGGQRRGTYPHELGTQGLAYDQQGQLFSSAERG
jgi:predicted enzyme related to lactoylglutathione lyase